MKFDRPQTEEDLADLYDHIYKTEPNYGRMVGRHRAILAYIAQVTDPKDGVSVLDAGCGRGDLLFALKGRGYMVGGTEVSRHLFDNELKGLPIGLLRYEEYGALPDNSYDVVISSDVLEHMCDWDQIDSALGHLSRISRKYLCITTANHVSRNFSGKFEPQGDWNGDLHLVHAHREEWAEHVSRVMEIDSEFEDAKGNTFFFFGKSKKESKS